MGHRSSTMFLTILKLLRKTKATIRSETKLVCQSTLWDLLKGTIQSSNVDFIF